MVDKTFLEVGKTKIIHARPERQWVKLVKAYNLVL